MQAAKNERFFSVELKSKNQIKTMTLAGVNEAVLFEGSIGDFVEATFSEGVVLVVVGSMGTLRLDLRVDDLKVTGKSFRQ